MKCVRYLLLLGLLPFCLACNDDDPPVPNEGCDPEGLEMTAINHFQVIGSHNSYRKRTYWKIYNLFALATAIIPDEWIPAGANPTTEWDYQHLPLNEQFNHHAIRSIELDLYNDPEGGLYANRLGNVLVGENVASNLAALSRPGAKVMHFAHLDYETHYLTFKQSLQAILQWSENHPDHFPIYVLLELKDKSFSLDIPGLVQPFNDVNSISIANEINSVIPADKIITPDELRTRSTLAESVQLDGWPTLAEARGKLFFVALGENEIGETVFGSNSSTTNHAEHIFKVLNASQGNFNAIQNMVAQGFMVRTRADAGTAEARSGNTAPREAAFASGAQIISTDYYRPDYRYIFLPNDWTDYCVRWPGGMTARTNEGPVCFVE